MNATDKSPLGTFLGTMLSTHAHKMGLRVDLQEDKIGRVHFVRHDVTGSRSGEDWFCFSLVLVSSDHSVGIWTRDMMAKKQGPLDAERSYHFHPNTFDRWLDGWFEDAVLEELTRP